MTFRLPAHTLLSSSDRERCHAIARLVATVRGAKLLAFQKQNVEGLQEWRLKSYCEERIHVLTYRGVEVRLLFSPIGAGEEIRQDTVLPKDEQCCVLDLLGVEVKDDSTQVRKEAKRYRELYEQEHRERLALLVEASDLKLKLQVIEGAKSNGKERKKAKILHGAKHRKNAKQRSAPSKA